MKQKLSLILLTCSTVCGYCLTPEEKLASSFKNLELSAQDECEYEIQLFDRTFIASSQVFSPKYFTSTKMLTSHFPFREHERFLEIGCGIGVTSVIAAQDFANVVVAVDINPAAVSLTSKNAQNNKTFVDARCASLFDALDSGERFDTIYWDLPYLYADPNKNISLYQRSVCDPGFHHIELFLQKAKNYLLPNGRIIVGFGNLGDFERFKQLLVQYRYTQLT